VLTIPAPNSSRIRSNLRLVGSDLGTGNNVGVEVVVDVCGVAGVGALDLNAGLRSQYMCHLQFIDGQGFLRGRESWWWEMAFLNLRL
jgi:hypothetical protein